MSRAAAAILALRLTQGLDSGARIDPGLAEGLAWGLSNGLLAERGGRIMLTPRGRLLSNEVFARLLPERPGDG